LALLILLHVAAAIKHQWFDKHALIQRMWLRR
jgi:cytochrome b561